MLGASATHALAGELTLKPVLSEIGCSCPTPALFLRGLVLGVESRARCVARSRRSACSFPIGPDAAQLLRERAMLLKMM